MRKHLIIDIETTGLNRFRDRINICGVRIREDDWQAALTSADQLSDLLASAKSHGIEFTYVYQNGKFDTLFIEQQWGISLPIDEDVMLLAYVLEMGEPKDLKTLARRELGVEDWDIKTKEKKQMSQTLIDYNGKDLLYTDQLHQVLLDRLLASPSLTRLYYGLVLPSYRAYCQVERNGIQINMTKLRQTRAEFAAKRDELLAQLKAIRDINWNSNAQVSEFFYSPSGMAFPVIKRTEKGAPSVDSGVLETMRDMGYEAPRILLEYKYYDKAIGTFLDRWESDQENGRLYPTFNIDITRTGRTSCSNPNLQQVPRDLALRSLFTARPGYDFIEADQSQVELRIAAYIAMEPTMLQVYRENGDLHTRTAQSVSGHQEISHEERSRAKAVNFGFLYGMSAKKFRDYAKESYGVTFTDDEAKHYRDNFFRTYPVLQSWYKRQHLECEQTGGVTTKFGRFRALPDIYSDDFMKRSAAERKAVNTPVQSCASDILLCGLIEIVNTVPEVYVVGTVHDSILMEVPHERAEELRLRVRHIMEHPRMLEMFGIDLPLPLKVDAVIGDWGSK